MRRGSTAFPYCDTVSWGRGRLEGEFKNWNRKGGKSSMETRQDWETKSSDPQGEEPRILEEISIEEVFVDGICGVY